MKKQTQFIAFILAVLTLMSVIPASVFAVTDGTPLITAAVSSYDPIPVEPGKKFDVWISIQNTGDGSAKNVKIKFVDSYPFTLISDTNRETSIPVLGEFSNYLIKYTVLSADKVPDGESDLSLTYTTETMPGITGQLKVPINVQSAEANVMIESVKVEPESITPGSSAKVVVTVKNSASSTQLRDFSMDLQLTQIIGASNVILDLPFVPVGSSSKKSVKTIAPGASESFTYDLAVYPDAQAKIYKIPLTMSYSDDNDKNYTKSAIIGVVVNAKPELSVTIESSTINTKSTSGEIKFNIINKGISNAKLMTLTLETSSDYEILSASKEQYIGNIDSDDFENAVFEIKSLKDDKITLPVKIEYRDPLNNKIEETFNVEYTIRDPVSAKSGFSWTTLIIVLLIVGIGVYFFTKRKSKSSKNKD